ncbi:unnamed protein product, partial [marine sediment metagenome]
MRPRSRWAEIIMMGEEIGDTIARRMKPKEEPTIPPSPPLIWEETLPVGTRDKEIILGIKAKALNIRTDRDIVVNLYVRADDREVKRWPPIPVPASESPLDLVLPEGEWIERMFITASAGATIKAAASVRPISISFGRAKIEGTAVASFSPMQSYWYWAYSLEQPAGAFECK